MVCYSIYSLKWHLACLTLKTLPKEPCPIRPRLEKHWSKKVWWRDGLYTEREGGDSISERDRGVHGVGQWWNTRLSGGHPLDGGRGGKEWDNGCGGDREEDKEEKGGLRFFIEKDCWAWEKWVGRGRGVLTTDVWWGADIGNAQSNVAGSINFQKTFQFKELARWCSKSICTNL